MQWLDRVIVALVAWPTFSAFRAGLIRQVVPLVSLLVGGVVAGRLYARLAANLDFLVADEQLRSLTAFVAILAGFMIIGQVLGMLLKTMAGMLLLGPMDHFGGAVFGLVRGLLTVALLLSALTAFPAVPPLSRAISDSTLAPLFMQRLPLALVERFLPDEIHQALELFRRGVPPSTLPVIPAAKP